MRRKILSNKLVQALFREPRNKRRTSWEPLCEQPGLDKAVEKAKESVVRARIASELASESAIKARESLIKSAQLTRELAQEAKRKARGAKIMAVKAKRDAKLASRIIKEAKEIKSRTKNPKATISVADTGVNAVADGTGEPAKADLNKRIDLTSKAGMCNEAESAGTGTTSKSAPTGSTKGAKWLGSDMFEGRADILMKNATPQQVYGLADLLRSVQNLKVEFVSGSEDGSSRIALLADQPIPLVDTLSQIPIVDEVTQFGWRAFQLSLKN
jgi:hypothetical protein